MDFLAQKVKRARKVCRARVKRDPLDPSDRRETRVPKEKRGKKAMVGLKVIKEPKVIREVVERKDWTDEKVIEVKVSQDHLGHQVLLEW